MISGTRHQPSAAQIASGQQVVGVKRRNDHGQLHRPRDIRCGVAVWQTHSSVIFVLVLFCFSIYVSHMMNSLVRTNKSGLFDRRANAACRNPCNA
jgi:hypothetical protein